MTTLNLLIFTEGSPRQGGVNKRELLITIISTTSCSRMVIKIQMISRFLVEIYVYMPLIHGSEFSCRYRAFCYTVSLVHATNSGERVWGISQQESCVRFILITLFSTLLEHRDTCFWYWSFFQERLWFLS